jgi:hypothetical protein
MTFRLEYELGYCFWPPDMMGNAAICDYNGDGDGQR